MISFRTRQEPTKFRHTKMSRKRTALEASFKEANRAPQSKRRKTQQEDPDLIPVYTRVSKGKGFDSKDWNETTQRWASFRANLPPEITAHILSFVDDRILPINKHITIRMIEASSTKAVDWLTTRYPNGLSTYNPLHESRDTWWALIRVCQAINTCYQFAIRNKNSEDSLLFSMIAPRLLLRSDRLLEAIAFGMVPTVRWTADEFYGQMPSSQKCCKTRVAKMGVPISALLRWFHLYRILLNRARSAGVTTGYPYDIRDLVNQARIANLLNFRGYFKLVDGDRPTYNFRAPYGSLLPPTQRAVVFFEIMEVGDPEYALLMNVIPDILDDYALAFSCHPGLLASSSPYEVVNLLTDNNATDVGHRRLKVAFLLNPMLLRVALENRWMYNCNPTLRDGIIDACKWITKLKNVLDFRWRMEFMRVVAHFDYKLFASSVKLNESFVYNVGGQVDAILKASPRGLDTSAVFHYLPATSVREESICYNPGLAAEEFHSLEEVEAFLAPIYDACVDDDKLQFVSQMESRFFNISVTKCQSTTLEDLFIKLNQQLDTITRQRLEREEKQRAKQNAARESARILSEAKSQAAKIIADAELLAKKMLEDAESAKQVTEIIRH
jgi:hypothetical protein